MSTQLFTVPSEISKLRLNHVMSHHPERINLKLISWRKDCNLTRQILSHHSFNHWKTLRSIFSHSPYPSSILNYWSRAPQNILTSSDFLIKLHCNLATSPKLTSPFPKPHPPGSRPPISRQTRRDAKHRLRKFSSLIATHGENLRLVPLTYFGAGKQRIRTMEMGTKIPAFTSEDRNVCGTITVHEVVPQLYLPTNQPTAGMGCLSSMDYGSRSWYLAGWTSWGGVHTQKKVPDNGIYDK